MESSAQHPPSKIARFSHPGIGRWSWGENFRKMEINNGSNEKEGSPPNIGVGLELGNGSGSLKRTTTKSCSGFTISQMQELQLQFLIYKYMESGLPVPNHLVLPIWKSVATSFGGRNSTGLHQLFPNFFGCGSLPLEYRKGMDAEPGRCRRTDGKKWRCSKEAVPDHKYCEKHIHRGRQRSRKHVEVEPNSQLTAITNTSTSAAAGTNLAFSLFSG